MPHAKNIPAAGRSCKSLGSAIALSAVACLFAPSAPARADESAILAHLREYFASDNPEAQAELVAKIEADPVYQRERVAAWLHAADLWPEQPEGLISTDVGVSDGTRLGIRIRVPRGYDRHRAYPLVYALHGTGGTSEQIIGVVEQWLGDQAEQYLIAAPQDYRQVIVHSSTPPSDEHDAALLAIRRAVHVDSDRVIALGYSRGGHASWTLAATRPELLAGAAPIAGTLILQFYEHLYERFLPNVSQTHVLCCWGAGDTAAAELANISPQGGIAGLNRVIRQQAERLKLPIMLFEDSAKGHGGIEPPPALLRELLAQKRVRFPLRVAHTFRVLEHGRAYWLEPVRWMGESWDDKPILVELPEDRVPDDAEQMKLVADQVAARLGWMEGEISGQRVRVRRKHVDDFRLWFGDGMIDWSKPAEVTIGGRKAFNAVLEPRLGICLRQAARTRDFERLFWAGLDYDGSRAKVIRE